MQLLVLPAVRVVDPASGALVVSHEASGATEVLVPGDEVVLLDVVGELHAGVVTALGVRDGQLHYSVREGVRLPPDAARARLAGAPTESPERGVSDQSLLDLLGEVRDRDDDRD